MRFKVEVEREEDGRWIAEVCELPGVLVRAAALILLVRRFPDTLDRLDRIGAPRRRRRAA